jgi:hypothetical protein
LRISQCRQQAGTGSAHGSKKSTSIHADALLNDAGFIVTEH